MSFKFCPECGAALEGGARFCGSCGRPVGKEARAPSTLPLAGIVALVALLVLGGGFWLYFRLAPEAPRPLKPGERAPGVAASGPVAAPAAAPGQAPHPPFELPEDIKSYMAGLQEQAEANPEDIEKWKTLAGVYYRASRLDPAYAEKAQKAFEHVAGLDENDGDALRGLGNLAYDRQDRATAISYYERFLAKSPANPEVRTDLGTMYYESGKAERAIEEYERVLEEDQSFYQARFNLAVVYDAQGDREAAHAQLEKARELAPEEPVKQRIGALLDVAREKNLSLTEAAATLANAAPPGAPPAAAAPGAAPEPAPGAAPEPDSFETAVEQLFRGHPIAGPKITSVEWPESGRARVLMAGFPMDQMPEVMKNSYLGKMSQGLDEAREEFEVEGPVTIELVDQATGTVMATVDPADRP